MDAVIAGPEAALKDIQQAARHVTKDIGRQAHVRADITVIDSENLRQQRPNQLFMRSIIQAQTAYPAWVRSELIPADIAALPIDTARIRREADIFLDNMTMTLLMGSRSNRMDREALGQALDAPRLIGRQILVPLLADQEGTADEIFARVMSDRAWTIQKMIEEVQRLRRPSDNFQSHAVASIVAKDREYDTLLSETRGRMTVSGERAKALNSYEAWLHANQHAICNQAFQITHASRMLFARTGEHT